MRRDLAHVVLGAVDEARLAPAQERQAEHVEPRRVDDATIVAQVSPAVEDRDVEPGVVRPVSGGPDDRAQLASELGAEPGRRGDNGRVKALDVPDVALQALPRAQASNPSSRRFIFRSASAHALCSEPENSARVPRMPTRRPHTSTPCCRTTLRSSVVRSALPTSCGDGRRRARTGSSISSMRWSSTPLASSHHWTSRPR